ncbi:glycosyltransferase family 2 protein, partial [Alistipes communis]|uniref:glycosyltransferase family 2 protein n=1 Tax=Alistipes communis TaxID=2585118 RepID=UPI003524FAD8
MERMGRRQPSRTRYEMGGGIPCGDAAGNRGGRAMSATASPKVSVIVPVHNTAQWLDRCVESVRAQTLRDIEIILVENRSTDAFPRV